MIATAVIKCKTCAITLSAKGTPEFVNALIHQHLDDHIGHNTEVTKSGRIQIRHNDPAATHNDPQEKI